MMARGRAARTIVVIISLAALVVIAAVVLGVVAQGHPSNVTLAATTIGWPRHFTVADWRRHPDERYYMAFDLAKSGLLRGKSKAEVLAMLGKPASGYGSDLLVWPVSYPFGPDVDALVVWTRNGVVSGWSTSRDTEMGPEYK